MEEDKTIKKKKTVKKIYNIVLWTCIIFLLLIISGISFLFINAKIADKNNQIPTMGLYTVTNETMSPEINAYDVVLTYRQSIKDLKVNDAVTYYSLNIFDGLTILTNKVVKVNSDNTITVSGNLENDVEETIVQPNFIGKVIFVFPKIGNIQSILSSSTGWLLVLIIPIVFVIIYDIYKFGKVLSMRKRLSEIKNEHGNI